MVIMLGTILVLLYVAMAFLFVYLRRQRKKVGIATYDEILSKTNEMVEPMKAPNISLKNMNGDTVNLFDSSPDPQILAFVHESCIHCNSHLETLIVEIKKMKRRPIHITVIVDNIKYGHELAIRYGSLLTVLLGEPRSFEHFNISFFPAFMVINNQYITVITPDPGVIIRLLNLMERGA